jgi:hypothetical protein
MQGIFFYPFVIIVIIIIILLISCEVRVPSSFDKLI